LKEFVSKDVSNARYIVLLLASSAYAYRYRSRRGQHLLTYLVLLYFIYLFKSKGQRATYTAV